VTNARDTSDAESKSTGTLIGAGIVSVSWVCFWGYLILVASEGCDGAAGNWWQTHVSCLGPNEIGDTLAGGFAPLALIWLMTAVLLQSRELRAQRQELALTRNEMRESRAVLAAQKEAMDAQVAEARRNVEYIGQQTQFIREDRERSKREMADSAIDTYLGRIVDKFSEASGKYLIITRFHVSLGELTVGSAAVRISQRAPLYYALHTIMKYAGQLRREFDRFLTLVPADTPEDQLQLNVAELSEILEIAQSVSEYIAKNELSTRKRDEFIYYEWERSIQTVSDVVTYARAHGFVGAEEP
jgi:hypothetical protein